MKITVRRSMLAMASLLCISFGAHAGTASCETLRADQARFAELLTARQDLLARHQRDLEDIKAEATAVFGDKLPTLEERNRLASLAAKELRSLEPKASKDPKAQKLQERIDALNSQLRANQKRSVQQLAEARSKGPEAEVAFERETRDESIRLNAELKALYAEQQAAREAAIADPSRYALKKLQLRSAVRLTELEDRQGLIDGMQKTVADYRKKLEGIRAQQASSACK